MSLLDRAKERIETDLSDLELQSMLDQVTQEIEDRFGASGQITVHRDGGGKFLGLTRPLDGSQSATVTEISPRDSADPSARTELAADDYRILHGGRTLERLAGGTNGASRWAGLVEVTYTPVSDAAKREEVILKVVAIDAAFRGVKSERAGDWQASYPDAAAERELLIMSLQPRPGLAMA